MAGFSDFMGAMRFGMGLVSGFTHQAQQERQANETQQLALLKILKDQQHDIVSIDPNEVQQSGGVLGALFGAGGGNTFNIGGRGFKVVRKPPMFGAEPTSGLAPTATTEAPALNYNLKEQEPSSAPTTPAAPAVPAPTLPTTPGSAPINAQTSAAPFSNLKPEVAVYKAYIDKVAPTYGLDPNFVKGLISHENPTWNPTLDNEQYGPSGGQGLGQLVPGTAAKYKVEDVHEPYKNLNGSMAYLKDLKDRYNGDTRRMAAAYLAGEGNIPTTGVIPSRLTVLGRPVDVSGYVQKVHANAQREAQSGSVASLGTFAGPGATAPPTPGAAPETQVAGRAVPGVTAPMAPLPFSEKEMTLQQKLDAGTLDLQKRFYREGVVKDPKEDDRFLTLQATLHNQITQRHFAEVQKVQKAVTEMLNRQQGAIDPRIVDLADRVENESQLRDFKRYLAANAMPDILAQKLKQLGATPLEQRPQKAMELSSELFGYGYKPERIREAFKPYMSEVDAARTVQKALEQHEQIRTSDATANLQVIKDASKRAQGGDIAGAVALLEANKLSTNTVPILQQALNRQKQIQTADIGQQYANVGDANTQTARQQIWKEEREAGNIPMDIPIGAMPAEQEEKVVARQRTIASDNAIALAQAKNTADQTKKLLPNEVLNIENPETGEYAKSGMTPQEIAAKGMIKLDFRTKGKLEAYRGLKPMLDVLEKLAVGGKDDSAGTLTGVPGSDVPGIFTASEGGLNRVTKTIKDRIKAFQETADYGRYVQLYDMNAKLALARIAIVIGGDPARLPVAEFLRTAEGVPLAMPGGFSPQHTGNVVKTQYRLLRHYLEEQRRAVLGENTATSYDAPVNPAVGNAESTNAPPARKSDFAP